MSSLPSTQRAWRVIARGPPSTALKLVTDLPVPTKLEPGYVLVKVEAAALNPVGYKTMKLLPNLVAGRPITAEQDFTGIIIDANGTRWSAGDAVFGIVSAKPHGQGALSEYTVVPADSLGRRPTNITPTQASGIATVGLTAYMTLFDLAKLEEGQTVFINGGSTAVGTYAIQLAKARGIRVVATASGKNEGFVKRLGADEFIDYTKEDLATYLANNPPATKFHAIIEAVGLIGDDLYGHCEKYLAPGGIFVSVGPQPLGFGDAPKMCKLCFHVLRPAWLGGPNRKWTFASVKPHADAFTALEKYIAEGKVIPAVDSIYSFEDALKAYDKIMTRHATGKVVVKVDPNVE